MLTKHNRATVIGGSLAGLFAGALLHRGGWEVQVYERSSRELESRGGGIVLQPEVVEVFRRLGLDPDGPAGVWARERIFLDRAGRIAQRVTMPQKQTSWNAIYRALRSVLPKDRYHQGATFHSLRQTPDRVWAIIDGVGEVESDLLIGADGGGSAVRGVLWPDVRAQYAGYVAFRGLVPEAVLAAEAAAVLRDRFTFFQYERSHMLVYLVASEDLSVAPGARRYNWVWYRNADEKSTLGHILTDRTGARRDNSVAPGMLALAVEQELREAARGQLPWPMRMLVEATREPFVQAIIDLEAPSMAHGRVALVGDAAFVPRPHTAASTSKAAANVLALVDALAVEPDVTDALRTWEPAQLELGRYLRRHGQMLGDRSQFPERAALGAGRW
jgi:2-polyprenyl-6-methoxyphenol hydroxylase-like FAD-dependent oxidoreductase